MENKGNKKARVFAAAVIMTIILLGAGGTTGYAINARITTESWEGLVYPGVKVAGLDISGKSKNEAINLLKSKYGDAIVNKKINITAEGKTYSIEYSKLNAGYDIENAVDGAFKYGKNLGLFSRYKLINEASSKDFNLKFAYDDKYITELIVSIENDINKEPQNATIGIGAEGKIEITPDMKGAKLESVKLEDEIKSNINGELSGDVNIQAPIQELTAAITTDKLNTIDTRISSYSTSFSTSIPERINNIELATKALNGKLLMPGDSFSFNETVGERTRDRGYKEAGVIINNQISSDLGGGICQVSSTFYNALLRTELANSEMDRIAHSLPSTYVPKGLDATVDWGKIDFKFKNTLEYPIYIEGYTQNKNLYFNIYSNSSFKNLSYTFTNDIIQNIPTTTKTIEDPTLPEGQKIEVKKAYPGYKVKVTKNTLQNGSVIKSEVLYTDYYKPVAGELKVGTKKQ